MRDGDCARDLVCVDREDSLASRPGAECLIACEADGDCPLKECHPLGFSRWSFCEADGFCGDRSHKALELYRTHLLGSSGIASGPARSPPRSSAAPLRVGDPGFEVADRVKNAPPRPSEHSTASQRGRGPWPRSSRLCGDHGLVGRVVALQQRGEDARARRGTLDHRLHPHGLQASGLPFPRESRGCTFSGVGGLGTTSLRQAACGASTPW